MALNAQQTHEPWQKSAIKMADKICKKSDSLRQDLARLKTEVASKNWPHDVFRNPSDAENRFRQLESSIGELCSSASAMHQTNQSLLNTCEEFIALQSHEASSNLERSSKAAEAAKKKLTEIQTCDEKSIAAGRKFQTDSSRLTEAFTKAKNFCDDEAEFIKSEADFLASQDLRQPSREDDARLQALRSNETLLNKSIETLKTMIELLQKLKAQSGEVIEEADKLSQFVKDIMTNIDTAIGRESRVADTLDAKEKEIQRLQELLRKASK